MSSLSPIAQNPAVSNLANLILAANFPKLSISPVMSSVSQNINGNAPLPIELDLASQGIGMPTVYVKPQHLNYLRDFRTQQCPLFANHKCTQHKPFTCFHWHFPNQRRRRPLRKADGTFSYSPDVYCDKYDEARGECPSGDACPYLHRNAGDTERRYHLRYFKTGTCIHDTDTRGHCSRNGAHCAFAHGANDLRVPVYDVREVQEASDCPVNLPASLEKERVLSEDPKWNDMSYVLANYKTEQCRKPPRMCRQGYACPFYHNTKDKRRGPQLYKYRSTPCPTVKSSDEWLDSNLCEHCDDCQYCHTRTEQQFHPEIYKSTKCNDVMQQNYCPRGPFCAFAHDDAEMNFGRNFIQELEFQTLVQATLHQHQHQHQHQQHQQYHQQNQAQALSMPLDLSQLISPNAWEAPNAGAAVTHTRGRPSSGASLASVESGLGSMHRAESPISRQLLANHRAPVGQQLSPGSAMLPELDDLDLSQPDNAESEFGDSFSPLTVLTSSTNPIGIPGACSPAAAAAAAACNSDGLDNSHLPFQALADGDRRRRMHSGGDLSSASSNYAQSPILMSNSPFSNAGMDLERLQYQQEIEKAQEEKRKMQEAMQRAQRERDDVQGQLEAVRERLRDISSLAGSASGSLGSCSPHELQELQRQLQRHLQTVQQLTVDARSSQTLSLDSSSNSLGFSAGWEEAAVAGGDLTPSVTDNGRFRFVE